MNDMCKLLDKVKFDVDNTSSWVSSNTPMNQIEKKHQNNLLRTNDSTKIHVLPLPYLRQVRTLIEGSPINHKMLLVEDNAVERQACRKALAQWTESGMELIEVSTGEKGLYLAGQQKFDFILLDYQLPDMGGQEFLNRLAEFKNS